MKKSTIAFIFASFASIFAAAGENYTGTLPADDGGKLTDYVNPFLGTATLWDYEDLQYERHRKARTWGAETFPGASLPNAMVQLTPVTMYHSGSGYQYEDLKILGFAHTSKGHWNLCHVPILPVTGRFIDPEDHGSEFSHSRESARPGYYQVYLDRYGVNAELTSTLRCAYHRYTYRPGEVKKIVVDITRSNNNVSEWSLEKAGHNIFTGSQRGDGKIYFYAVSSHEIENLCQYQKNGRNISVISFREDPVTPGSDTEVENRPLELKIGFSFVSVENARMNLEAEMLAKSFEEVASEADAQWETLLSKIRVKGGTERQKRLFYSTLYRSFLWPALRSDTNGDYTDVRGEVVNNGFRYYTDPSFWDDHRNKLILLGLISPDVACDIVKSISDKGEKNNGYMPTFFHGDHASTFISGMWRRDVRDFDLEKAYRLILKNATVPGRGGRRYMDEYLERGWISDKDTTNLPFYNEFKGGVQKVLEYSYDDYATAQVAKILGDTESYDFLMKQSQNYRKVFDPSTGFYRGRIEDGSWYADFDPYYPYFQHMYREANAWNVLFYPPHDPMGVIGLYPGKKAVEAKLDSLFTEPWRGYEVENLTGFIGQYCHGNQPGHNIPYAYYFIDKQEKSQHYINQILDTMYDMGKEGLAYSGMDDAGEMSSWYVFNAIGLYTYSPADPEYIVTVPIFDEVEFSFANGKTLKIVRRGNGEKIRSITCGGRPVRGYFVQDSELKKGDTLVINTK
ncbi:MAG: glycoside hydrolase family 92 protein [Bacteroidales bacterium]|nr:glycoside hydrolase family 92 protein [Bacteroidales bacterium]